MKKINIKTQKFFNPKFIGFNKSVICGMLLMATLSCEEDLKLVPENNITQTTFYKTELEINQAVTGVYSALVNSSSRGGFDLNYYFLASEVRSNNMTAISQNGNRDYYAINRFQDNSSTAEVAILWEDAYQLVTYANNILARIDAVAFASEATREQYRAEVKFLRAYTYFELMRTFGRVPLIDKPITAQEATSFPRTDIVTIYNFITSELEASVGGLLETYPAASKGRITKAAAHAMLGRVYLTGFGYPLKNASYLPKAKQHLAAVIQREGSSVTFAPNYADMFKSANDNKYHIFEIQHVSGGQSQGTFLPSYVSPVFGKNDPLHNAQTSLYSSSELAVSQSLINSYEPGDLRYAATIKTSFIAENNQPDNARYFVKFREGGLVISNKFDWPINFPIIRYADVLLMYAEVLNEEGNTSGAVTHLNRIRTRAGLAALSTTLSSSEFTTALRKERRIEFAGEGIQWHDLVRWNVGVEVINQEATQLNYPHRITTDDYLYQLPLAEVLVAGYDQNP